jgi:hypothetical protein
MQSSRISPKGTLPVCRAPGADKMVALCGCEQTSATVGRFENRTRQIVCGQTDIASNPRPNTQAHRFLTVKVNCDWENCGVKQKPSL